MPRTAPTISEPKMMLSRGITFSSKFDAGQVIHAGVEEHVLQQVIGEQRALEILREPRYRPNDRARPPPPCGMMKRSVGKSLNKSLVRNCMNAVVSALMLMRTVA